jgi:hypothetical protein
MQWVCPQPLAPRREQVARGVEGHHMRQIPVGDDLPSHAAIAWRR